ncbi:Alpha-1,2-mannosidase [Cystobacter fuscus DSM 2262]|uniref:Alpha-1,2-mannosidase n=1 Tax=Cystobacter fuscus (strain ATCC 25194 / DSM 2262 / NBRC 100088 / M29) TaxID=1242864 RepID=S9P1U8_CYSF2|nr:GH92 family glycosyl hydrolase [Cystobacter fuscus]EPX57086.1 Alpha-1,2-mannosidase [Cystobacter fuscus DSM 2262]
MIGRTLLFTLAVVSTIGCGPPSSPGADAGSDIDAGSDNDAGTDGGSPGTPPPDFYTSFEDEQPQPTWVSTVELDAAGQKKSSGVTGEQDTRIRGNIMGQVTEVTANGENPPDETADRVADGEVTSKWLTFTKTGWVQFKLEQPVAVKRYALSSANDAPERDPTAWTLEGSQDGTSWTALDQRSGESFAARFETKTYEFTNTTAYPYYRLNVTANRSGNIVQLAELQLSNGDDTPPPVTDMKSEVGSGPGASWNSKIGAGFTGTHALRFAGAVTASGRGYSYNKLFDVDVRVTPTTELSYLLFVDSATNNPNYPSTYAALDLAFDDGTYLSELNAVDQHHAVLSPAGQGASRTLYPNEWNYKVSRIGDVAAGKTIKRILIGYDQPQGPVAGFGGWIDDVRITATPVHAKPTHLSDYVTTLRGTHSSGSYSRGNNFPATAIPHGFNFWTPVTDASSASWLYAYHRGNNANNRPALQALSLSHEPSPWMGDRQSFQVLPSVAKSAPNANRASRALAFQHENEIARPYYYGVKFDNGVQAELTPTDHAALFRFTFPGDDASLIFDNVNNNGGLTLDPAARTITGYSDARSGLSVGASRMFVYATFDRPVATSGMLSGGGGANVTGYFRFTVPADDRTVTMRIATSLISVEQARKNLALEIAEGDRFEDVKARAQKLWDQKLGIVEVQGASEDQLTTLYSNLYRLFLYPNSGFENTGTAAEPVYQHASPVTNPSGTSTPTQTGAKIVSGKIYVNNGFWDTYRVTWPAYALFTPSTAGELIDGFAQHYREGGWIARWSSPGYADLMTGTSSDVAFADAYVKGVRNFDAEAIYDAAVRNATVPPTSSGVGRKGLESSIFLGYTPTSLGYGLSWAMAGYLNDFGIANMARALATDTNHPRHQEFAESAEYFLDRAQQYVNLFDPSIQFFQGRSANGVFAKSKSQYDPRVWGHDYTETNGWNMAFDAPHDGLGLAALYGGRAGLGAKLDEFFATPETASFGGSYGGVIHEMVEARDVRMGQLGLSNQPSFHIPYMYVHAGQPAKTQEKVRDALARLFVGSNIGQGYLGDEDNGATSAWHIFSALGFYPLGVGSENYVIGSPLFTQAVIHLENGKDITINAPNNGPKNVYVQALKVNGQAQTKTYLTHEQLTAGITLDFDMGPAPSAWGTGAEDAPPSITTGGNAPNPLRDTATGGTATSSDATNISKLFDDTSATNVSFTAANPVLQYQFASGGRQVTFYTLTSGTGTVDPTGWTLSGSNDGVNFTTLDQRGAQTFRWRTQTRAFRVATPGSYAYYRLELTGAAGMSLAEVELLARP